MKSKKLFAVVVFVVLAALGCAMSAAAEDAVFTCDSDPADFNGKTFENLYVLLNGCDNFKSTIFPDDNVFVTLRDITVNGTLYYVDDSYDRENGIYTEVLPGEDGTRADRYPDHYLNFAGESSIDRLEMNCINPHICHLNLDSPSYVDKLFAYPTLPGSSGKIDIDGFGRWFVFEDFDYYSETKLIRGDTGNEYDFDAIRNEIGHWGITNGMMDMFELNRIYTLAFNFANPTDKVASFLDVEKAFPNESFLANVVMYVARQTRTEANGNAINDWVYNLLFRSTVNKMYISNKYEQEPGETYITLGNIRCNQVYVSNNHREDEYYRDTYDLNWKPVIEAVGYTNIGLLSVYSDLSLKTLDTAPYKAGSSDYDFLTAPLFVDALVVGTEGREANIVLDHVKIFMFNYLGGTDRNSQLNLTTLDLDTKYYANLTGIGILTVNGGNFKIVSEYMSAHSPTVFEFYTLPGRADLRYTADASGIIDAASIANISGFKEIVDTWLSVYYNDNIDADDFSATEKRVRKPLSDSFERQEDGIFPFIVSPGTVHGLNWIFHFVQNYLVETEYSDENNYDTHVDTANLSVGNEYFDPSLNDNWYSGSCNLYQWGEFGSKVIGGVL